MARFPDAQQIIDAFRAEGLDVYEMPGWRGRCRCCTGPHRNDGPHIRGWADWNGITIHHTAGPMLSGGAAITYTRNILIGGNGSTPGPLCLAGIDADGRLLMTGAGRANHIGGISQCGLDAMVGSSFSLDGSQNLRGRGVDGNSRTLGFEILAPGAPNPVQRDAAVRASAALCRIAGWSGREVHGHGEVSDQRDFSDPGLDMGAFRRDVMARTGRPAATPAAPAAVAPLPEVERPWWGNRPWPQEPAFMSVSHLRAAMEHDVPHPSQELFWFADQVWALQRLLIDTGWLRAGRFVAGHYGTYTKGDPNNRDDGGVMGFQCKRGHQPDGWVGPSELRWLMDTVGRHYDIRD